MKENGETYSKSSKREREELRKIQQEREKELLKIQQERERSYSKSSKRNDGRERLSERVVIRERESE